MTKTATKKQTEKAETKKVVKNAQTKDARTQAKNTHTQTKSTIDKKLVVKMFKAGKTPYQIAKAIGKYYSQVAPILQKEGFTWEKRPQGPTDKKTRSIYCSDEQYKQIQQFLAK